jgi:hypothetical protein
MMERWRAGSWEIPNISSFLEATPSKKTFAFKTPLTLQEKIIFFLGAQPGDKNFLQTNEYFCTKSACT